MDTHRYIYAVNFFVCAFLCGVSFFYNSLQHLPLCPLCSLQVIIYYIIALTSLITFFVLPDRKGRMGYGVFIMILTGLGVAILSRQLWMDNLPNLSSHPCAPDMMTLFLDNNIDILFKSLTQIYNHCTLLDWKVLGLGMPQWSMVAMIFLFLTGIYAITRPCGKSGCKTDFDE